MKRIFTVTFASLCVLFFLVATAEGQIKVAKVERQAVPSFVGYVPDAIVVKLDKTMVKSLKMATLPYGRVGIFAVDQLGTRFGVAAIQAQFPNAQPKFYQGREIDLSGWYKIKFADKVDVEAVVQAYKSLAGVLDAQPIGIHTAYVIPNDGSYSSQWHLNQANDHDMDAPEAWDIETGEATIIGADLDTGIRYFHKDLGGSNASYSNPTGADGNMWINTDEINGNGIDDDGNGYVDDWVGYDFVSSTSSCWSGEDCSTPDNDPRDFNGHGTHTAGLISALTNNGYATASVAGGWGNGSQQPSGNGVKVMALRIGWSGRLLIYEVGYVSMDFAAQAFYYAANNGAKLANCSWGSSNSGGIADAVSYFLASGGLIFKSAGNDNNETADYINGRGDANIISVASTDQNDLKSDFSSYGTWVDISAPGTDIVSLYHNHSDPQNDYIATMSGTSMASPNALSVAALIWSQNPSWTADQVRQRLFDTADDIDGLNPTYAGKLGAGRVNAFNAVNQGTPCDVTADFSGSPTSGCAPLTVNFTDQSTGSVISWAWNFGDGGTSTAQNPSHTYNSPGNYSVTLTASSATCSDVETKSGYITVTGAPTAAFVGSPTSGAAPLTVNFTDQSTGNPTSWSWDFGDGGTSTLQNPSHQYTTDGTYTVSLTASNACGSDVETKVNYITVSGCTSTNVALNKTATASSQYSSSTAPSKAVDGKTNTRWRSANLTNSNQVQWLEVDLGASYTVDKTVVNWYSSYYAKDYQIQYWNGSTWVAVVNIVGNASGGVKTYPLSPSVTAQRFRLYMTKRNTSSYRVNEFEIYSCVVGGASKQIFSDIEGTDAVVPTEIELHRNYPNPFNPSTNISFSLPQETFVSLKVYNVLGAEVATLVNERCSAGMHTVMFDAKTLPSGVYFSVLQAGEVRLVRRFLLMK